MTPLENNATTTAHPDCPHCGERSCVAGTTGGGLSCSRCGADVGMGEALAAALAEVARLRGEAQRWRHRALEHCACYVHIGRPSGFNPDKEPCACSLSECERPGECCA